MINANQLIPLYPLQPHELISKEQGQVGQTYSLDVVD